MHIKKREVGLGLFGACLDLITTYWNGEIPEHPSRSQSQSGNEISKANGLKLKVGPDRGPQEGWEGVERGWMHVRFVF